MRTRLASAEIRGERGAGLHDCVSSDAATWRDRRETLAYAAKEKSGIGFRSWDARCEMMIQLAQI